MNVFECNNVEDNGNIFNSLIMCASPKKRFDKSCIFS